MSETGAPCLLVEGWQGAPAVPPETDTNENAMTDQTQAIRDTANKPGKKPYEPPRILSRERMEAVAGGCGKDAGLCPDGGVGGVNS